MIVDWLEKMRVRGKQKRRKLLVKAVVVGLGLILFWRGAWTLFDHLIFPGNPVLSGSVSLIVGIGILYFSNKLIDELLG